MPEGARKGGVSYHCLRVAEQSPAAEAGIEPFFDFVCGVQGRPLVSGPRLGAGRGGVVGGG